MDNKILAIRNIISSVAGPNVVVVEPREDKKDEYLYAIFLSQKSLLDYEKGYDSEDFIIWNNDGAHYGYSIAKYDPGVWRRTDGSGEPPSLEFEDSSEEFKTVFHAVYGLAQIILHNKVEQLEEDLEYCIMEYGPDLKF